MSKKYKIRFFHGVNSSYDKEKGLTSNKIYSTYNLSADEYSNLKETLKYQYFLTKIEKAYELIVHNYRDYEQNNFSIILNHTLETSELSSKHSIVNSIDRHISNILTSTYLYTSLLRINRKNTKINDYSFDNSTDYKEIYDLKMIFKNKTNEYHSTIYHYTFMSALRNKLNHGGDLLKQTIIGGSWSSYWVKSEHDENLIIAKKDKRFSELDIKVSREEAEKIISNKKHFSSIKEKLPDSFYLRNSIRIYVDLLSSVHAELRKWKNSSLENSNKLIKKYLSKSSNYSTACIIQYENTTEQEKFNLFSYFDNVSESVKLLKAPLYLEYYNMPGEYEERKTIYKMA